MIFFRPSVSQNIPQMIPPAVHPEYENGIDGRTDIVGALGAGILQKISDRIRQVNGHQCGYRSAKQAAEKTNEE